MGITRRKKGSKVPGKSTKLIREEADCVRKALGLGTKKVSMISIIEFILPSLLSGFSYEIKTKDEMGSDEALTYPDRSLILIREDVYISATNGEGRAQFTLAHELGHLVMHTGLGGSLSYARNSLSHEVYEDSEWQADTFASEFLMPYTETLNCINPNEIHEKFGVSISAAETRFSKIR